VAIELRLETPRPEQWKAAFMLYPMQVFTGDDHRYDVGLATLRTYFRLEIAGR